MKKIYVLDFKFQAQQTIEGVLYTHTHSVLYACHDNNKI